MVSSFPREKAYNDAGLNWIEKYILEEDQRRGEKKTKSEDGEQDRMKIENPDVERMTEVDFKMILGIIGLFGLISTIVYRMF